MFDVIVYSILFNFINLIYIYFLYYLLTKTWIIQEKEEKMKFKLESREKLKDEKKEKTKDKDKEKVKEKDKEKVKEKDKDKKDKKLTKVPSTFTCGIPFEEIFTLGGKWSWINFIIWTRIWTQSLTFSKTF